MKRKFKLSGDEINTTGCKYYNDYCIYRNMRSICNTCENQNKMKLDGFKIINTN